MKRETARLWLEPYEQRHAERLNLMNADPYVMRFLSKTGETLAQTKASIDRVAKLWDTLGYSWWALIEKESGLLIGAACLQHAENNPDASLEIGWRLLPEAQGKGYATEAGQAAIDYAFGPVGADHVIATTHPDNAASIKVMERLGMTFRGIERHYDTDCPTYILTRDDAARGRPTTS